MGGLTVATLCNGHGRNVGKCVKVWGAVRCELVATATAKMVEGKSGHLPHLHCRPYHNRRRYTELTVGYAESHDQALVGGQTVAFQTILIET